MWNFIKQHKQWVACILLLCISGLVLAALIRSDARYDFDSANASNAYDLCMEVKELNNTGYLNCSSDEILAILDEAWEAGKDIRSVK